MKIVFAALALVALAAVASPHAEAAISTDGKSLPPSPGVVSLHGETVTSVAKLAGPWAATIVGSTGCGFTTMYATFRLNVAGSGSATTTYHTASCGDSTSTNPVSILGLKSDGAGTAHLSCGEGCGWDLNIQVLPGNKLFSLVDVSPENPNNYIEGTAVRQ